MVQLEIYLREIIHFLRTVTLKNTYFADQMFSLYVKAGKQSSVSEEYNPYYVHLNGDYILKDGVSNIDGVEVFNVELYSHFDEMMTVVSLDTLETIEFTKENLIMHPKTAALYKIPNTYYSSLCDKYPNQVDLIKAIVYPIADIYTAIRSPNLTLLQYDAGLLAENERHSIVSSMLETLIQLRRRWDVKEFVYEELYAAAHQGLIWNILYTVLFVKRIENIRTNNVHPYHIWEYLQSKGLGNYRDVLSNKQQLFLYRNMDYLLKNKGTTNNLTLLIENLLNEYNIDLQAKQIVQSGNRLRDDCVLTPSIISSTTGDQVQSDFQELVSGYQETLDGLLQKEKRNGQEPNNEYLFNKSVKEQKNTFSNMPYTYLPTKLLELKKANESMRYATIYAKFVAESLLYRASENDLGFNVLFIPPEQKTTMTLTGKDTLALLLYSVAKEQGITYIKPPNTVQVQWPYRKVFPSLNKTFKYHKTTYTTSQFLSETGFSNMVSYPGGFLSSDDMAIKINNQAINFLEQYIEMSRNAESKYEEIMAVVYKDRLVHGTVDLNMLNNQTYVDWFKSEELLGQVISRIESEPDTKIAYSKLTNVLLEALYPYDTPFLQESSTVDAMRYFKLRKLLVSLCSYNISIIDATVGTSSLTTASFKTTFGSAGAHYKYIEYDLDTDAKFKSNSKITQNYDTDLEMEISDSNGILSTQVDTWDPIVESTVQTEIVQNMYVFEELYKTHTKDRNADLTGTEYLEFEEINN